VCCRDIGVASEQSHTLVIDFEQLTSLLAAFVESSGKQRVLACLQGMPVI
jgi:hypothetical protein